MKPFISCYLENAFMAVPMAAGQRETPAYCGGAGRLRTALACRSLGSGAAVPVSQSHRHWRWSFTLALFFFCPLVFSQSPCSDPRYLELRKKSLDAMSQREFDYFMLKEKLCVEETAKNTTRLCTLVVVIDSAVIDGKEKEIRIFVDDVETSPVSRSNSIVVTPGIHRISLFSLTDIEDYEKKINRRILTNENKNFFYGIGVMEAKLKQMKNTVKAVNAPAGKRMVLHYRFFCDTGKTGKCNDDGWSLIPELN